MMRPEGTGTKLERQIKCILKESKIPYEHQKHNFCKGMWGENVTVDFHVPTIEQFQAIETKWQQVCGSADQKLHYTIYNIKETYPCKTVLVIDGGGFRPEIIKWVCKQTNDKFVGMYALSDFIASINNGTITQRGGG